MKTRTLGLVVACMIPLAACDAGETGEMGELEETGVESGLETAPAGEAPAADVGFATWDTDANQQLVRSEWDTWYGDQNLYSDWNTDAEEGLTRDELAQGAYGFWDADDDGGLTEAEWNEGLGSWYGEGDYGAWGEWDADGDSVLDANEVAEGLERENLYDRVDRDSDALIDDEELADFWFDIWDGNDDALIDTTEWDQVGAEWSRVRTGGV